MKKFLIMLILLACVGVAHGYPKAANDRTTFRNGYAWTGNSSRDLATQWAQGIEGAAELGSGLGTGEIWYVDFGVLTEGDGKSWREARDTLDEIFALIAADGGAGRGDVVKVAEGHNESLTTNEQIDVDVLGVRVIGYGVYPLRPRFDYDAEGIESAFVIGASGVILENLDFLPSVSGISAAIEFEAVAAGAIVRNCGFLSGEAKGVDEFNTAIRITSGVWDWTVTDCVFDAGSAGASSAITINMSSGAVLANNRMYGDYSSACASTWNNESVKMFVLNNIMINGELRSNIPLNTEPAFAFRDGCQGLVKGNLFASNSPNPDTLLGQRTGLDMIFIQNIIMDDAGEEFTAGYVWGGPNESIASSVDG